MEGRWRKHSLVEESDLRLSRAISGDLRCRGAVSGGEERSQQLSSLKPLLLPASEAEKQQVAL